MPYGYPSGEMLVEEIKMVLKENPGYDAKILAQLQQARPFSIDAFLNKNPEYSEVLKPIIGALICRKETFQIEGKSIDDDWIKHFFYKNQGGLENYRFITFNYDRSLEYNLLGLFKGNNPGMEISSITDELTKLKIVHVHGRIPYLSDELGGHKTFHTFEYGDFSARLDNSRSLMNDFESVFNDHCVKNISTVYEKKAEATIREKVLENLNWANRIIFLGFGYLQENLDLLGINVSQYSGGVFGTGFELGLVEAQDVKALGIQIGSNHQKCVALFKNKVSI